MRSRNSVLLEIGQNIRVLRKARGLSQEALAFKAELDRTYIGGVERGERNISALNICRIAEALGVPPSILLDGVTPKSKRQE